MTRSAALHDSTRLLGEMFPSRSALGHLIVGWLERIGMRLRRVAVEGMGWLRRKILSVLLGAFYVGLGTEIAGPALGLPLGLLAMFVSSLCIEISPVRAAKPLELRQ